MEERIQNGEVVESYRRPQPQEVVFRYTRELAGQEEPFQLPARSIRKKRRGLRVFLLFLSGTLLLASASLAWQYFHTDRADWDRFEYFYKVPEENEFQAVTIPAYPFGQGAELSVKRTHGDAISAQEIYQRVNPAVVAVMAQLSDGVSVGTGVIFTEDGYFLTNYHVVEGGSECQVILSDGRTYQNAKYVAGDAESDLAVLKMDLMNLPTAEFGDSDLLSVGDPAYAIGNPLGVRLRGTLTDGVISAINRDVNVDGRKMTLIQTNAALNSGNSGGPLINVYGQVVGINTIKMVSSYSNIEGLGFAIPSASIRRMVNDLLTFGEIKPEPVIGVSVNPAGTQLASDIWGVEVMVVNSGSAAERAGIEVGDYIVSAGGESIVNSQDLLRARRQYYAGDEMPVTIWRSGKLLELTLSF